jgi:hypothetical protein
MSLIFTCSLFNDAVSNSNNIASNVCRIINNESEIVGKETLVD